MDEALKRFWERSLIVKFIRFDSETELAIAGREVDEYKLTFLGSQAELGLTLGDAKPFTVTGRGSINWDEISERLGTTPMWYDNGYGAQVWSGWITFKDSGNFLLRHEYDGSESWEEIERPSLDVDSDQTH